MKLVFNDGKEVDNVRIEFNGGKCTIYDDEVNTSGFKTYNNGVLIGNYPLYNKLYRNLGNKFILIKEGKTYEEELAEAEAARKELENNKEEVEPDDVIEEEEQEDTISITLDDVVEFVTELAEVVDVLSESVASILDSMEGE